MRVLYAVLIMGLCAGVHYLCNTQEGEPSQGVNEIQKVEVQKAAIDTALATAQPDQPSVTEASPQVAQEQETAQPVAEAVPADTPQETVPAQTETPAPAELPVTPEVPSPISEEPAPVVSPTAATSDQMPPAPEPTAQEPVKEDEIIEIKGIDTLDSDEPKGNWLLKRIWWENAERGYEKIKQTKQKVIDSRMSFFQKRTEFDRAVLDPFYIKVGVGQGELKEILSSLLAMIEQMRTAKGSLNEQERELLVALELEQETLNGLDQKLKAVTEIDNAIDDALLKLIEQINRAHDYEHKAWDAFKTITRELSDKRARELYYSLDGNWKNIRAISEYIQKQFTPYFDQLLERAQSLVSEMDASIQSLKEKGIDIKMQAQKLNQQEQDEKDKEEEAKPAPKTSTWLSPFYSVWNAVVDALSGIWNFITSFFVSSPKPKPVELEAQVEEVVTVDKV